MLLFRESRADATRQVRAFSLTDCFFCALLEQRVRNIGYVQDREVQGGGAGTGGYTSLGGDVGWLFSSSFFLCS